MDSDGLYSVQTASSTKERRVVSHTWCPHRVDLLLGRSGLALSVALVAGPLLILATFVALTLGPATLALALTLLSLALALTLALTIITISVGRVRSTGAGRAALLGQSCRAHLSRQVQLLAQSGGSLV